MLSLSLQWSSAENPLITVSGTSHDGACGGTVHVRQSCSTLSYCIRVRHIVGATAHVNNENEITRLNN